MQGAYAILEENYAKKKCASQIFKHMLQLLLCFHSALLCSALLFMKLASMRKSTCTSIAASSKAFATKH